MGVTGSGKTFTMANIIANVNKPTLVLAHNKTLAAQLCSEFREFFPENAVEYFVSYYDYYQPEAYVPGKDIYIEKDASVNSEIDKLRHSATSALFERRDVIIVASVSCIFSLGDPEEYKNLSLIHICTFCLQIIGRGNPSVSVDISCQHKRKRVDSNAVYTIFHRKPRAGKLFRTCRAVFQQHKARSRFQLRKKICCCCAFVEAADKLFRIINYVDRGSDFRFYPYRI